MCCDTQNSALSVYTRTPHTRKILCITQNVYVIKTWNFCLKHFTMRRMFNEIQSRYFWHLWSVMILTRKYMFVRKHGCIPCNVTKNAAFVLTCHYSNTNLKNSRQRHGNKKCGGRGPFRFLNSVSCDCVTQVKFPARTFRFVSSTPQCLKEHCGKPAPFNAYWLIYRCV